MTLRFEQILADGVAECSYLLGDDATHMKADDDYEANMKAIDNYEKEDVRGKKQEVGNTRSEVNSKM